MLNIISMEILDLFSQEQGKALIKVLGDTSFITRGMKARIESIPKPRFIAEGYVEKVDNAVRQILVRLTNIISIPEIKVGEIAKRTIIYLDADQTLLEASTILSRHGIRGAPVREDGGNLVGFFTASDLARAIAKGLKPSDKVRRALSRRDVITISQQADIFDAISLMESHGIGRLVLVDSNNNPIGIITRTDILKLMAGLKR
jgi:predicted transcriptional regulator